MLARRDQENLAHGHQMAAASKPLNQGLKQMNPKTPGNKAPKTPFKVPLNDENNNAFATGKAVLKTGGKVNGTIGKKNLGGDNFVTPMGPRTRAPLGQKTTNAKAKVFQTPGLAPQDDLGKSKQKSASARKPKPRVSHTEPAKIDVLADPALEERDIEYMPPPVKNLPDVPDDGIHNINLSMFENGGATRGCLQYLASDKPDVEGITHRERSEMEDKVRNDRMDAMFEAQMTRDMDMLGISCDNMPECVEDECKHVKQHKRHVEIEYEKRVASIKSKYNPKPKKTALTNGPSTNASKKAASNLSMAKPAPSRPAMAPKTSRFPASMVTSKKSTMPPIDPNPRRHASAVRASHTTLGYSKGRAASATLRGTILPQNKDRRPSQESPDTSLAPAVYMQRYGAPPIGSETWMRFKRCGYFADEEPEKLEDDWSKQLDDLMQKDAEEDFELTF